ncbi:MULTISPECIES: fascin domain-containing protein [Flavobacterium]|uniref:Ig-like domain-containing protein n=1 Tax=Flavobacterium jumunjinense TaxID=998845 RepID=A0ABV5GSG0_9FLAO|nr:MULTISPECIES: hypothetical protein [Flavobacterium]
MKLIKKTALLLVFVSFFSCSNDEEDFSTSSIAKENASELEKSGSRYMTYGDVVTIFHFNSRKFFTGEANGDATINKQWNSSTPWVNNVWFPYAKFKIVNPNNPSSTALVKTGDEIALRCIANNYYICAESWDDDVNVNRTAIGPWEKWRVYAPSNVTVGNSIFYSSVGYLSMVSLKSTWNKYLRPDGSGSAKAGAPFDPTTSVLSNLNCFQMSKQ